MKKKKKELQTKYIVKPEDGVVVCIISDTMFDVLMDVGIPLELSTDTLIETLLIKDSFKGVARLVDGDKWDEALGKEIAFGKAYHKYLNAKMRAVEKIADELYDVAEVFDFMHSKYNSDMCLTTKIS